MYRISVDTGGTFTDAVVVDEEGRLTIGKALTTPGRSFDGLIAAVGNAAEKMGIRPIDLLARAGIMVYGTTRATNAIVEGKTARTALLVTRGFPDILIYRRGGKLKPHRLNIQFPPPYIPRHLTFQVPERINAEGGVEIPIDLEATAEIVRKLKDLKIESVAVSLLWSIANPFHERAVAAVLNAELPGVPYTLSSDLNPTIREYPRTSSTAIDASLKPLMQSHLTDLQHDLLAAGFKGELLISVSSGGVMHLDEVARRPIYMVKSGPAMAPVAGTVTAAAECMLNDVIVLDAGGTTFDVSLVRKGTIKYTRETWLGEPLISTLLGMASVDVRSVGAGGGSIAWIDSGGLLNVGPQSAGSVPGPACYGRGGSHATVTDAAVVLGYMDAHHFLDGRMVLDRAAAHAAIARLALSFGATSERIASAILEISSETMIKAIEDITVNDGINPRESLIVAGGGAAGLTVLRIAARLGCGKVIIPKSAGALSAWGAQFSDVAIDFSIACVTSTGTFDAARIETALAELRTRASAFQSGLVAKGLSGFHRELFVEARYHGQQAELEIEIPIEWADRRDPSSLKRFFDEQYFRRYGMMRAGIDVETINWRLRVSAPLPRPKSLWPMAERFAPGRKIEAYFADSGRMQTQIYHGAGIGLGTRIGGPAIIEEPTTTIVVPPGAAGSMSSQGNYVFDKVI